MRQFGYPAHNPSQEDTAVKPAVTAVSSGKATVKRLGHTKSDKHGRNSSLKAQVPTEATNQPQR